MSVQFGVWNVDGKPVDRWEFDRTRQLLSRFSSDGEAIYMRNDTAMCYRALHTTEESRRERQPYISRSGLVITWDGRLDNREQLTDDLGSAVPRCATDVEIVAAAYEKWGQLCFARLIGDWALSIWNPFSRSVVLAVDFVGTRHLYYTITPRRFTWSTTLDPLILVGTRSFELEEEYVAGWLASFPAPHLTPYKRVHAVPPCSFVSLTEDKLDVGQYWEFAKKQISYGSDQECEERFRDLFAQSVRRRLRSKGPVLAELSGGIDSTSIVCMADDIIGRKGGQQLDTVSYYDDTEPSWNERPFFMQVEAKRGRTGCHINLQCNDTDARADDISGNALTPGHLGRQSSAYRAFATCLEHVGARVLLSGIGGDEVLGGVPNPIPELADLMVSGRFATMARKLNEWALSARKPCIHLLRDSLLFFCAPWAQKHNTSCLSWISAELIRRNKSAFFGYRSRVKVFGPAPSLQENLFTLEALQRQLACVALLAAPACEIRFPYLDRDLLSFLYAIPREQIVRPHQRRSLMRRSLRGIVPAEILDRRRKAFVNRAPLKNLSAELAKIQNKNSAIASFGFVNPSALTDVAQRARNGDDIALVPLLRAITLNSWLSGVIEGRILLPVSESWSTRLRLAPVPQKNLS
jgi:asparagine synthase (glutamine-hydrolysing)